MEIRAICALIYFLRLLRPDRFSAPSTALVSFLRFLRPWSLFCAFCGPGVFSAPSAAVVYFLRPLRPDSTAI
jgi:hypothetical protein